MYMQNIYPLVTLVKPKGYNLTSAIFKIRFRVCTRNPHHVDLFGVHDRGTRTKQKKLYWAPQVDSIECNISDRTKKIRFFRPV